MLRSLHTPAVAALSLVVTSTVALAPACGSAADLDAAAPHGATDDGALDAAAILAFVNSEAATYLVLNNDVGLNSRAARAIFDHVWGLDEQRGTGDDNPCETLAELDAIPNVGDAALRSLDVYVAALAPGGGGVAVEVEGVSFTAAEAASALSHCNQRTEAQLDEDVGLDARAAREITWTRPHANLESVARVAYVGATALEKIRAYAALHPVGVTPPPGGGGGASAPRIVTLSVEFTYDVDPEYEEGLDGANVDFTTSGATSCDVAAIGNNGAVLEARTNIGTVGPFFFAGFAGGPGVPDVDIRLTCRNANNVTVSQAVPLDGGAPPPPVGGACDGTGGNYDGVAFTQAQECAAVAFMNGARWSAMGGLSDAARRIAYDGGPNGVLGQRQSAWTNVAQFAALPGVGRTAVQSLRTAAAAWVNDGDGRFDTVALTWQNRAALGAAQAPISLDRVYVTRKTVDFGWPDTQRACVEVRDAPNAPNYIEACLFFINADSAPGCSNSVDACLDPHVGEYVKIRGRLRVANGRTSITLHTDGPMEARASLD